MVTDNLTIILFEVLDIRPYSKSSTIMYSTEKYFKKKSKLYAQANLFHASGHIGITPCTILLQAHLKGLEWQG